MEKIVYDVELVSHGVKKTLKREVFLDYAGSMTAMGFPEDLIRHKLEIRNGDLQERMEEISLECFHRVFLGGESPRAVLEDLINQRDFWLREQSCRLPCEKCLEMEQSFSERLSLSFRNSLYFRYGV